MNVMTVKEGAAYLRTSMSTMYHLVESNEVAHVKIGKKVIILQQDLDKYLMDNRIKSDGELMRETDEIEKKIGRSNV